MLGFKLRTDSLDQPVFHVQSEQDGTLAEVLVAHGDTVEKNQVIARLDAHGLHAAFREKTQILRIMAEKTRLQRQLEPQQPLEYSETLQKDYADLVRSNQLRAGVEDNQLADRLANLDSQIEATIRISKGWIGATKYFGPTRSRSTPTTSF